MIRFFKKKEESIDSVDKQILESKVVSIGNRRWDSLQLTADFYLEDRQAYHGMLSKSGYLFVPITGYNRVPNITKILWKNRSKQGFCGYPAALKTEISFSAACPADDRETYRQILTPYPIQEKRWVPFPDYHCVPLLKTTMELVHHWATVLSISQAKVRAEQNFQDYMAMRRATYDLNQNSYS